jgi:heme-degrading monooxygenase HmoA
MFIAMNRFRVKSGAEGAFEKVWLSRDSYLDRVPGFVEFHLLKGPEGEDHTLYASHTLWHSKAAFEAWTKSEEFRAAHARAGNEATEDVVYAFSRMGIETGINLEKLLRCGRAGPAACRARRPAGTCARSSAGRCAVRRTPRAELQPAPSS